MSTQLDVLERTKIEISSNDKWKIVMHNDNRTSMEVVVHIIWQIFKRSKEDSVRLMFEIHNNGSAVITEYSDYEMAEQKAQEGMSFAREYGYPLKITVEK